MTSVARENVPFSEKLLEKLMKLGEADKAELFMVHCIGEFISTQPRVIERHRRAQEHLRSLWDWQPEYCASLNNRVRESLYLSTEVSQALSLSETA